MALWKNSAPKEGLLASKKSIYESDPRILQVIKVQPQMLAMFGLNPATVLAELEKLKAEKDEIEKNYDSILNGFKDLWVVWIMKYKSIISNQKQSDDERRTKMDKVNPAFILRNYLMQEAIEKAE